MWKHKPPALLILNLVVMGLLVLLAFLQYRWMGQVSQADRERRKAALQETVARFCGDLDRELTRAFFHFSLDHHEARELDYRHLRESASPLYASRYLSWIAGAPSGNIVSGLFFVNRGRDRTPRLARFGRDTSCFEPVAWPGDFQELQDQIRRRFDGMPSSVTSGPMPLISPLVESIPALVIPCFHRPSPPGQGPSGQSLRFRSGQDPLVGVVIVQLDRTYLIQEFLPKLAKRHFFQGRDPEYDLVVVRHHRPDQIIYQSSPALSLDSMGVVDAKANCFRLQPDELVGLVGDNLMSSYRSLRAGRAFWRASLPPPPNQQGSPHRTGGSEEIGYGDWEVLIRHRAGSLDAVVASARRRNLAISFSILLLLGCSMALVTVSVRRAQRLAQQQMDFVAAVSHELRTPLAVICSAGENLADGMITDPRQSRKYGILIREEGRRLASMVEQVLNFAGIHSARKLYDLQPIDPIQLVERALTVCSPTISQGGFQIQKEIATTVPPILGDSMALSVCLENLLRNAMQYSGNSRWIGIRVNALCEGQQEWVVIAVSDKGIGIDPKDIPHIFNSFYRGRTVIKAQIRGTGLGLSLVKNIVEGHSGRIHLTSKPGQGSTFTLLLPAQRTTIPPSANEEPGDTPMEPETDGVKTGYLTKL
jgi:signal transduction histidine kinase